MTPDTDDTGSDRTAPGPPDATPEPALMDTETTQHLASEMAAVVGAFFGLLQPHRLAERTAVRPGVHLDPTPAGTPPGQPGHHGDPSTGPAPVPLPLPDEGVPPAATPPAARSTLTSVPMPATVPVTPPPEHEEAATGSAVPPGMSIPVPDVVAVPDGAVPDGAVPGVDVPGTGADTGAEAASEEAREARRPGHDRRSMALLQEIAFLDE
jgi:hypothetical protein